MDDVVRKENANILGRGLSLVNADERVEAKLTTVCR